LNNFYKIFYDSDDMKEEEILQKLNTLLVQKQRWIATNHPDGNVRSLALKVSGVDVGKDVFISIGIVVLDAYENLVKIGDRCAFGDNVSLIAASGPNNSRLKDIPFVQQRYIKKSPITIGSDCWIGSKVTVLPNVTIGSHSIIGAGSVLHNDVPDYSVFAGVPAKFVRTLKIK
jgi:acetyltransferase-like isoleucine patch superfamily enzyme